MKRVRLFFVNVFLLTVVSIIIQFISISFNVYITNKIGTEVVGLYHLILSVYFFSVTFATSGITLSVTRLVSEHLAIHRNTSVSFILKRCILYALFFGIGTFLIVFNNCEFIGNTILKDERAVMPIKILSVSMPFISLSSVFNGYFTAKRKVYKNALTGLFELFIRIGCTVVLLNWYSNKCVALFLGSVAGEISSFILMFILYLCEGKKFKVIEDTSVTKKLLKISLPIAFSTYLRTGLNSIKQIIIPRGLVKSGQQYKSALSNYGMVNGMVFPIITFPMNILYSCSNMLVPELSECVARNNTVQIKRIVKKALKTTTVFSVLVFLFVLFFHNQLATAIYKNTEVAKYLFLLCPIILTMYIDAVTDGMLKGLNQQLYSMKYNIIDSFVSVILLYILLPKFGLMGYIIVIYISEILNTSLSLFRLYKVVFAKSRN